MLVIVRKSIDGRAAIVAGTHRPDRRLNGLWLPEDFPCGELFRPDRRQV
ncbi:MAG: hypothetical protein PHX57_08530 [Desulfobulbaceae bacterium]|nr:hypothetical protein [Desulfobulbaceae bacterium]